MFHRFILASCLLSLFAFNAVAACSGNAQRYTIKNDVIYDKQTKLSWQRCTYGMKLNGKQCTGEPALISLSEATAIAKNMNNGWRVPTAVELYELLDARCGMPPIDTTVFTDIKDFGEGATYWSSTPVPNMDPLVLYINYLDGSFDGHTDGFALAVRFVKSK